MPFNRGHLSACPIVLHTHTSPSHIPHTSELTHFIRGEKTAAVMENQLTALERKIDDLLASVDGQDKSIDNEMQKHENPSNEKS